MDEHYRRRVVLLTAKHSFRFKVCVDTECHQRLLYSSRHLIRSDSPFGPRSNPNFQTIDVTLRSLPGSYHISDLDQPTAEANDVDSMVRARATPKCSIHDISDSLASDILAKFPAAIQTDIHYVPNIRTNLLFSRLLNASCRFSKVSTRMKRPTAEHNSVYNVMTRWHLTRLSHSKHLISLMLNTEELSESTVHGQISGFGNLGSLHRVHPTFDLHERVASFAEQLQSDRTEGAAFLLAQRLFDLADKQSSCKRLQSVRVGVRVVALTKKSWTRREAMIEQLNMGYMNRTLSQCSLQLGRHKYEQSQHSLLSSDPRSGRNRAFLALGSNLGNRVEMIESAVQEMSDRGLTILRTSALYETKPMYLENQESFINGACEVCSTGINSVEGDVNIARLKHR